MTLFFYSFLPAAFKMYLGLGWDENLNLQNYSVNIAVNYSIVMQGVYGHGKPGKVIVF